VDSDVLCRGGKYGKPAMVDFPSSRSIPAKLLNNLTNKKNIKIWLS
jgi:hypothetical protein